MKLGFKSLVLALAVTLLCVPAAMAKNGNGHGKPSWAGGGGNGHVHGKPAWAGVGKGKGKDHAKHEKVKPDKAKHQKAGADDAAADEEINLDDLNPAWYCFTLEAMMDSADADAVAGGAEAGEFSSFDAEFGTNDNKRNSHGQCVSRRAQGEDLSGSLDDQEQSCDSADEGGDDAAGDDASDDDASGDDASGGETVSDDASAEDESADDPAADDGSEDQADQPGDCQGDDSSAEDGQDDEAGDQDEDSDAQDDEDQGDGSETAAFARALVRFIKL
jgi:ribonuclease E